MEFTETQLEALFTAKALAPKGFVPVEDAVPELEQLVEATWLRTEAIENARVTMRASTVPGNSRGATV